MKRLILTLLPLACATLVAAGCAKQELVKKDDQLAATPAAGKAAQELPRPAQTVPQTPAAQPAAAQQAKAIAETPATGAGMNQTALERIYFSFDSNALSDEARSTLKKNADLLKKNKALTVRIEGNCDERGSDEYNLALGEKRAIAARQYLLTLGASADRLSVISYGKEKPADTGHTEAAWAKNRRDDFIVTSR